MSTHVIIVYTELNALRTREAVCALRDGREIFVNNLVNRYEKSTIAKFLGFLGE